MYPKKSNYVFSVTCVITKNEMKTISNVSTSTIVKKILFWVVSTLTNKTSFKLSCVEKLFKILPEM